MTAGDLLAQLDVGVRVVEARRASPAPPHDLGVVDGRRFLYLAGVACRHVAHETGPGDVSLLLPAALMPPGNDPSSSLLLIEHSDGGRETVGVLVDVVPGLDGTHGLWRLDPGDTRLVGNIRSGALAGLSVAFDVDPAGAVGAADAQSRVTVLGVDGWPLLWRETSLCAAPMIPGSGVRRMWLADGDATARRVFRSDEVVAGDADRLNVVSGEVAGYLGVARAIYHPDQAHDRQLELLQRQWPTLGERKPEDDDDD